MHINLAKLRICIKTIHRLLLLSCKGEPDITQKCSCEVVQWGNSCIFSTTHNSPLSTTSGINTIQLWSLKKALGAIGPCSPTEVQCGSHVNREEGRGLRENTVYTMFPQPVCVVRIPYRQRTGRDGLRRGQMCGPRSAQSLKRKHVASLLEESFEEH